MTNWNQVKKFLVDCVTCGDRTSKKYASAHNGQCRQCVTGEPKATKGYKCPTCGENRLTAYQKAHGYHCDNCTRNADPMGYYNEVMGRND